MTIITEHDYITSKLESITRYNQPPKYNLNINLSKSKLQSQQQSDRKFNNNSLKDREN